MLAFACIPPSTLCTLLFECRDAHKMKGRVMHQLVAALMCFTAKFCVRVCFFAQVWGRLLDLERAVGHRLQRRRVRLRQRRRNAGKRLLVRLGAGVNCTDRDGDRNEVEKQQQQQEEEA